MKSNKRNEIEKLIDKAADKNTTSLEALQYSQAACNCANAVMALQNMEIGPPNH